MTWRTNLSMIVKCIITLKMLIKNQSILDFTSIKYTLLTFLFDLWISKGPLKLTEQKPEGKAPKKGKGGDGKTKATNGVTAKAKGSSNDKVRVKFFAQDSDCKKQIQQKKAAQQLSYANVQSTSGSGPVPALPLRSVVGEFCKDSTLDKLF